MSGNIPPIMRNVFVADLRIKCASLISASQFWLVGYPDEPSMMLYDTQSGLMWDYDCETWHYCTLLEAQESVVQKKVLRTYPWRLPLRAELEALAAADGNPLREGSSKELKRTDYWIVEEGMLAVESDLFDTGGRGCLIACSDQVRYFDTQEFVTYAIQRGWSMKSVDTDGQEDPLKIMNTPAPDFATLYREIDYRICRLPKLTDAQFTDPNLGLWEFYGEDPAVLSEAKLRARDPESDVKDWNIAIDFGTSSSVVAYDDNGRYKLLRIGAKDQWEKEQPEHYENPTVLEFIDLQRSLQIWTSQAYRPNLDWDNMRCSHEALHNLRTNGGDPKVVASILSKIKHWALRHDSDNLTRITDRANDYEYPLHALTKRDVVKGKPLTVSPNDPLDPIELYAWYLGMAINWRSRGLFLRYYMTFPVAYTKDLKETILMSFRRGLQRSLPPQLLESEAFKNFCVEELANEPSAYAAAALPRLGIEPTEEGIPYGVFDFGGGTTDFDFGRYRLPTTDEADEGWEEVFEHYGNAGDAYLGGENLLENMAYLVFCHNLEVCRTKRIGFLRPLDAEDFPGSEMFLLDSQGASTNSVMLMSRLRPLWEKGALPEKNGVVKLPMLNHDGEKIDNVELAVPVDQVLSYLKDRIGLGIHNFFSAMSKAFSGHRFECVHVLLAGNSSRSGIVKALFESVARGTMTKPASGIQDSPSADSGSIGGAAATMFPVLEAAIGRLAKGEVVGSATVSPSGELSPAIIVHQPLVSNPDVPYSPNGKTGVAIGLLRLAPGSAVKVISRISHASEEAPFAHYVGRVQRGKFVAGLQQGDPFETWKELGVPRDRVFNLFHSQSPRAHMGEMQEGEAGLYKHRLAVVGDHEGHRVFAKAVGPHQVQVCTARSLDALQSGDCNVIGMLDLTKI